MDDILKPEIPPFLKWAGGKRWLVNNHFDLFPASYERYFEPFLGSGAVFFKLQPKLGLLSDFNKELVDCYVAIKSDWKKIEKNLKIHHKNHSEEYYYKVRASRPTSPAGKAAKLIYLNRTCWNGLYRVNQKGKFNVPIGTKTDVILADDNFEELAKKLAGITISHLDFEEAIDQSNSGDFIFADPPYTVQHNMNGFVKYNERIFSWGDQIRLRDALVRAHFRGCKILVTNAYHESVKKLYRDHFTLMRLDRKSTIGGRGADRGRYDELIASNFDD